MRQTNGGDGGRLVVRLTRAAAEHLREHGAVTVELRFPDDTRAVALRAQVADYLAAHPDASANEVRDAVRGRRRDVLYAVRELRDRSEPHPALETPPAWCRCRGNHAGEGDAA